MKELGYQNNVAARSLKSDRSRTIRLIVPSITDPFFARFAAVAELHARMRICLEMRKDTHEILTAMALPAVGLQI
jgi:DNA-binding LacI/PurR family transcriptional regulator